MAWDGEAHDAMKDARPFVRRGRDLCARIDTLAYQGKLDVMNERAGGTVITRGWGYKTTCVCKCWIHAPVKLL